MPAFRRIAVFTLLPIALVGCGGSGTAQHQAAVAPARPGDLVKQAPREILARTATALRKVRSYHVTGTDVDKGGLVRVSGDVVAPGSVHLDITQHGYTISVVVIGAATYLRAGSAFWTKQAAAGTAAARLLSDRWVKAPVQVGSGMRAITSRLLPDHLAGCAFVHLGTLKNLGAATVAGKSTVVLQDKGDLPGSSPGRLYVATSGPALPLRIVSLGRHHPGGTRNVRCEAKPSKNDALPSHGETLLSDFDKPVRIDTPAGVLDLSSKPGAANGIA